MKKRKRLLGKLLCLLLIIQIFSPFFGGNDMKVLAQGETIKINFQPAQSLTPKDFLADYGEAGQHATMKKSVKVEDGRLTLSQINGLGFDTALNNIEISMLNIFNPILAPPRISLPYEQNKVAGDKVLMSGAMTNVHNAPPYTRINGLQGEISRHINEQVDEIGFKIQQYNQDALSAGGDSVSAIQQAINSNPHNPAIVKAGYLNLESSVTFGSPDKPVILIVDGINSNKNLSIKVYGTLILRGGFKR
jgi:hypothetical protein